MQKIIIAIVLAILIGGGVYYYSTTKGDAGTSKESTTENDEIGGKSSLKDLLGLGKNLTCTFSSDETGSGKVYVAGERVRAEFTTPNPDGGTITSNMISDGEWMYYWGSAFPQGLKMKFDIKAAAEDLAADYEGSAEVTQNLDSEMDYDCDSWRVDSGVFELPAGVEFVDFSVQTETMMEGASCSTCDYLTGDSKDACLQALGC